MKIVSLILSRPFQALFFGILTHLSNGDDQEYVKKK